MKTEKAFITPSVQVIGNYQPCTNVLEHIITIVKTEDFHTVVSAQSHTLDDVAETCKVCAFSSFLI